MSLKILTLPTFRVVVYHARNQKDMDAILKKVGCSASASNRKYIGDGHLATTHWIGNATTDFVIVGLTPTKLTVKQAALAAHEATHVMQRCHDIIGDKKPSDEVQACTVEQVTKWLLED